MALDIVLIILIPVFTIIGTGVGYFLSMRGKREEWAKEYREKRLAPLIDFVNKYMATAFEYYFDCAWKEMLEKQPELIADEMKRVKEISKAHDEVLKSQARLMQLHEEKAWFGFFMPATVDKQLDILRERWLYAIGNYRNQPTNENLENSMGIAREILDRADEVIIKGRKTEILGR